MTSKRAKNAVATDELDELFEGIGEEKTATTKKTTKAKTTAKGAAAEPEKDILAELENELEEKPASRPHTPRVGVSGGGPKSSPAPRKSADVVLPSRRSGESAKSAAVADTERKSTEEKAAPVAAPSAAPSSSAAPAPAPAASAGGGWWGGLLSTASAAMKQAEAAVKEIQQNEEAKKWADQVRGNYSALRGYGDELRHRAMPTFATLLHTLAPPIAAHERLLIHITHDMVGYPSLDPLVHGVFARVMAQVEGGDLLVIQRGQENTAVRSPAAERQHFFSSGNPSSAGWRDGPWWRATDAPRDLGAVSGLSEGTKLCRASAEAYAQEYYAARSGAEGAGTGADGLEEARKRAVEPMSESNPVRRSDLFLAVQAISISEQPELFVGSAKAAAADKKGDEEEEEEAESDALVAFAVYVLDPVHEIVYHTVSQTLPAKWVRWLDTPAALTPASSTGGGDEETHAAPALSSVPEDIRDIVEGGGVDPREWVAEWVEEALSLAVGVVAQRYVARRMGVGEGGIGKGKRRMDAVLEDGGGEAARAGLI